MDDLLLRLFRHSISVASPSQTRPGAQIVNELERTNKAGLGASPVAAATDAAHAAAQGILLSLSVRKDPLAFQQSCCQ